MHTLFCMSNVESMSVTVRRFERSESYVEFKFEGAYARMRNTLLERAEMTRTAALDSIATLQADGWVEVDAC
jgi:hypothetical protein